MDVHIVLSNMHEPPLSGWFSTSFRALSRVFGGDDVYRGGGILLEACDRNALSSSYDLLDRKSVV